jgi:hypothetical protein
VTGIRGLRDVLQIAAKITVEAENSGTIPLSERNKFFTVIALSSFLFLIMG